MRLSRINTKKPTPMHYHFQTTENQRKNPERKQKETTPYPETKELHLASQKPCHQKQRWSETFLKVCVSGDLHQPTIL